MMIHNNEYESALTNDDCQLVVEVKNLSFGYQSNQVLKDISFTLSEPSLVSIVGPNGVGKSTLVQCMNKILKINSGEVLLNGINIEDVSLKTLSKIIGYVPCITTSSFPIRVIDAVMMGRHPHSTYGSFDNDLKMSYDTLDSLEMGDLSMRYLNELSAGQHQKVMLAKGLVQKPKLLILDEPTANLDIKHQMSVTKLLRDISRKEKIIVLMICHDLNIASKYSDRVLMLNEGGVFRDGAPEEVFTPESLKKVYGIESKIIMDCGRPHILIRDENDSIE